MEKFNNLIGDPTIISTILSLLHLDYFNYNKNYKDEKFENTKIVDSISGGAFFLPREIFTKLKGLNENYFDGRYRFLHKT